MGKKINFKQMHSVIINSKPLLDLCFFAFSITFNALSCLWSFSMTKYVKQSCFFFKCIKLQQSGDYMNVLNAANVCLNGSWQSKQSAVCVRKESFRPWANSHSPTDRQTDRRTSCKCKVFRFKFIIKIEFWLACFRTAFCTHTHTHTHICIARESLIKFKFCMRWY